MSINNVGKFGNASGTNFGLFKSGLKLENLKNEAEKSIFKTADKDANGILDENEVNEFKKQLDASGDGQISKNEAKNYLKNNELQDMDEKEILAFLQNGAENVKEEDIETAQKGEVEGREAVTLQYKNGDNEIFFNDDNTSRVTSTDTATGDVTVVEKRSDKTMEKSSVTHSNGDTVTTNYAEDGSTPLTEVSTFTETGSTETISYEDGKPAAKDISKGTTQSHYSYDENGNEILQQKVENKGHDVLEKTTTYSYGEDGTVTENISQTGDRNTVRVLKDGNLVSEAVIKDGKKTETEYNSNGFRLSETVTNTNGETHTATFDGNGYGTLTMKAGETIESFAQRTGVPVEDIMENNTFPGGVPQAGQSIKVPDKYVKADDVNNYGVSADNEKEKGNAAETKLNDQLANLSETHIEQNTNGKYKSYDDYAKKLLQEEGISPISDQLVSKTSKQISEMNDNKPINSLDSINYPVSTQRKTDLINIENNNRQIANAGEVTTRLSSSLDNAKASFNQQMQKDGIFEDIADGVSTVWNSDNRASVVRKDFETLDTGINKMNSALQENDMSGFKTAFKETYGIEYNEDNVNEFYKNPTPENCQKAFGTSRLADIEGRVSEYNESQDNGGAIVKGVAVGAAGLATGGIAGAALATGIAATSIEIVDDATRGAKVEGGGYNLNKVGNNLEGMADAEHAEKYAKTFVITAGTTYLGGQLGKSVGSALSKTSGNTGQNIMSQAGKKVLEKGAEEAPGVIVDALENTTNSGIDILSPVKESLANNAGEFGTKAAGRGTKWLGKAIKKAI